MGMKSKKNKTRSEDKGQNFFSQGNEKQETPEKITQ